MKALFVLVLFFTYLSHAATLVLDDPQEMPQVKKKVFPVYPAIFRTYGVDGKVEVKAFVDEEGRVARTEVISATNPSLTDAADDAVRQWQFYPASKDGKPIKAEVIIPILFKRHGTPDSSRYTGYYAFADRVLAILRGATSDSLKSQIDPGAYAIIGNRYEHLYSLIFDKPKRDVLVEGPNSTSNFFALTVDDSEDMAVITMKTRPGAGKPERYHTIVLMKSSLGQWKIRAWHTSN